MSEKLTNNELTYRTKQTFIYYDRKSNHVVISTNPNAEYYPFAGARLNISAQNNAKRNSLYYIFATNAYGFNAEQKETIIGIKKELLGETALDVAPTILSQQYIFDIIDCFQYSITPEQVNAILTQQVDHSASV